MAIVAQFLDDESTISVEELAHASGLEVAEIISLVELGVLGPSGDLPAPWRFAGRAIVLARRAARLRSDFDLEVAGLALALTYIEQVEALETRIRELECQLLR